VIGKITRGERAGGLLRYLFGPTRFETSPHIDPHLVAAWDGIDGIEPKGADNAVGFDVRQLTVLLEAPLAYAERVPAKPVWHCSVRAAPTDRLLSYAEWADIARDVVSSVGLGPDEKRSGVRWTAVRHAPDHIHIVATLVREDGTPARLDFDKKALRSACIRIEERYGLRATAPADGTAVVGPSRAEIEKAQRSGRNESVRETLRRHVRAAAAGALTEADFWRRLDAAGVLVRHRMSERNPGEITGYSVALLAEDARPLQAARTSSGDPLFFSGGKLAPDLSLPKLRTRWPDQTTPLGDLTVGAVERQRLWRNAIDSVAAAERHIRKHTGTGTDDQAADTAVATMDVMTSAAEFLERSRAGPVHRAARHYERAAPEPRGQTAEITGSGERLRLAAVMIGGLGGIRAPEAHQAAALVRNLRRLIDAIRYLRVAQHRAHQAGAAMRARDELVAVHGYQLGGQYVVASSPIERQQQAGRRDSQHAGRTR
jgi:hypothetical protein